MSGFPESSCNPDETGGNRVQEDSRQIVRIERKVTGFGYKAKANLTVMTITGGRNMKVIRRNAKLVGVFLTILMLFISVPFDSVLAAMIETEAMLDLTPAQQARE